MRPAVNRGASGVRLVSLVEKILVRRGYQCVENRDFDRRHPTGVPLYTKKHKNGPGLYGTGYQVTFSFYHPQSRPECNCIQCRWQGISGSTDRKLPFDVLSINLGDYDTLIVIDGPKFLPEVENWLRGESGKGKLFGVFSAWEFYKFAKQESLVRSSRQRSWEGIMVYFLSLKYKVGVWYRSLRDNIFNVFK